MNNNIINMMKRTALGLAGALAMTVVSCNPEPDESDLYSFTGDTIESLISQDSTLTAFNAILAKVGYDKMMAAYGYYTCFAPVNDGVSYYVDSLYYDTQGAKEHNGMEKPADETEDYSRDMDVMTKVKWLNDSLCLGIAQYHIVAGKTASINMVGDDYIMPLLGYEFHFNSNSGQIVLDCEGEGRKSAVLSTDNEATNGLLHVIDNVIPRSVRFIGDVLDRNQERFSIFYQALKLTGLDSLMLDVRKQNPDVTDQVSYEFQYSQMRRQNQAPVIYPAKGVGTSGTLTCKVGYTLFAEPDNVMNQNGINDINGLIEWVNNVYANAPEWYDYMGENGLTVSTGTDYKNTFNALNMFVRYHILNASMTSTQLVYLRTNTYAHYAPDADAYDYYDTMLPHTMMKIWAPTSINNGNTLFINRYRMNNTLTDKLASQGSESIHELIRPGVQVSGGSLRAYNGYIHAINSMLVYDNMVPNGVLKERMRVNCTSLFPELINNGFRYWSISDFKVPNASAYNTDYVGIPNNYCDNMVSYNDELCLNYRPHSWLRCYQSDEIQFWGSYDWAFKLPSVPSGNYEIRVVYAPMDYGSFMQYYIGKSPSVTTMQIIGLPFDARITTADPRIGWTDYTQEDDLGVATDIAMHNRGYMRGPYSYYGGTGVTAWTESNNGRHDNGTTIRYVLGRIDLDNRTENWLRIKSLMPEKNDGPVGLDFIELVPAKVLDATDLSEDWY